MFLWWLADDRRLGTGLRRAIAAPRTEVLVSAASVWEIAIEIAERRAAARVRDAGHDFLNF